MVVETRQRVEETVSLTPSSTDLAGTDLAADSADLAELDDVAVAVAAWRDAGPLLGPLTDETLLLALEATGAATELRAHVERIVVGDVDARAVVYALASCSSPITLVDLDALLAPLLGPLRDPGADDGATVTHHAGRQARARRLAVVLALRAAGVLLDVGQQRVRLKRPWAVLLRADLAEVDSPGASLAARHARWASQLAARALAVIFLEHQNPDADVERAARMAAEDLARARRWCLGALNVTTWAMAASIASAEAFLGLRPRPDVLRDLDHLLHQQPDDAPGAILAAALLARQRVLRGLGDYAGADVDAHALRALTTAPKTRQIFHEVLVGVDARERGSWDAALAAHAAAARLLAGHEQTLPRLQAMNTACRGRLACDIGDVDDAVAINEAAVAAYERLGERWLAGLGLANLAQLLQDEGRFDEAWALLSQCLTRLDEGGAFAHYRAFYAAVAASLFIEWGRLSEARAMMDRALGATGTRPLPIEVFVAGMAALVASHDERPDLERIARWLQRGHEAAGAAGAAGMMGRQGRSRGPVLLQATFFSAAVALTLHHRGWSSPVLVDVNDDVIAAWRAACAAVATGHIADGQALLDERDVVTVQHHLDTRCVLRLLQRALPSSSSSPSSAAAAAAAAVTSTVPAPPVSTPTLTRGPDLAWCAVNGGVPVALRRRGALRRVLAALVEAHLQQAGQAVSSSALVAAGWPGERILPEAASLRLRVAIATLRKLGLRAILVTHDDGYGLTPECVIL